MAQRISATKYKSFTPAKKLLKSWNGSSYDVSKHPQANYYHLMKGNTSKRWQANAYFEKDKWVHPRDRIPYWHIVPGDAVIMWDTKRELEKGVRATVESAIRTTNEVQVNDKERLFSYCVFGRTRDMVRRKLKDDFESRLEEARKKGLPEEDVEEEVWGVDDPIENDKSSGDFQQKRIDVRRFRLIMNVDGKEYVASEVRMDGEPYWDDKDECLRWKRMGYSEDMLRETGKAWHDIPWPKIERKPAAPPRPQYDTSASVVQAISWQPSLASLQALAKQLPPPESLKKSMPNIAEISSGLEELQVGDLDLGGETYSRNSLSKKWHEKQARRKAEIKEEGQAPTSFMYGSKRGRSQIRVKLSEDMGQALKRMKERKMTDLEYVQSL